MLLYLHWRIYSKFVLQSLVSYIILNYNDSRESNCEYLFYSCIIILFLYIQIALSPKTKNKRFKSIFNQLNFQTT